MGWGGTNREGTHSGVVELTSPVQLEKVSVLPSVGSACIPLPDAIVISCVRKRQNGKHPHMPLVCAKQGLKSCRKHNGKKELI